MVEGGGDTTRLAVGSSERESEHSTKTQPLQTILWADYVKNAKIVAKIS